MKPEPATDPIDHQLILATQAGLPVLPQPYDAIGAALAIPSGEVIARLASMLERGIIRRIGVVPNHFALGYRANGMTVWDVDDAVVDGLGEQVGAEPYVTHCYRRPRHLPQWPYNLFAMVHGKDRIEVELKAAQIAELLGAACRGHDILYSKRMLKKTGVRLARDPQRGNATCSE
jgi:DNA-binding Lrp family transcriptional regulator